MDFSLLCVISVPLCALWWSSDSSRLKPFSLGI
jgi:hypothetical protein